MHKDPRPSNRTNDGDDMKLHLRTLRVAGREYRVVTLRPGTDAAFSTNYFHGTWHIVSDEPGVRLLARLLWGLAFQQHPGTLVMIHGEHLKPTPFDADPSNPIVLAPAQLTHLDDAALRALRMQLRRGTTAPRTIRWHTFGLEGAVAARDDRHPHARHRYVPDESWKREHMLFTGGCVSYAATPDVLRAQAASLYGMRGDFFGSNSRYLAHGWLQHYGDGEVQVFTEYRRHLSLAAVARREVLASPDAPRTPEAIRAAANARRDAVLYAAPPPKRSSA